MLIGGGAWISWGSGRVPVGYQASDPQFNQAEKYGGSKAVTLGMGNIPQHTHTSTSYGYGNNTWTISINNDNPYMVHKTNKTVNGSNNNITNQPLGSSSYTWDCGKNPLNHVYIFSGPQSGKAGKSTPDEVSIMQQYIVCYMWKRIS